MRLGLNSRSPGRDLTREMDSLHSTTTFDVSEISDDYEAASNFDTSVCTKLQMTVVFDMGYYICVKSALSCLGW